MIWIISGIGALLLLWVIVTYNGLARFRLRVRKAWAQVDVQLKKRLDLIPNLVATVQGFASHERGTFEAITNARAMAGAGGGNNRDMAQIAQADAAMSGALSRLLVTVENYPQLRADQNFLKLQRDLAEIERQIGFARKFYNEAVLRFNERRVVFPRVIVAALLGFREEQFFEAPPEARVAPVVSFN